MLVRNWMTKNVVTIDVDETMPRAIELLREHNIRMLPVMKKGRLVGVVTDRDLRSASASNATSLEVHELAFLISRIKVGELMTRDPITVPLDSTVEETAETLLRNKINGVPVVDHDGNVVGVITQIDLYRLLISLTGVEKGGIQFALMLEDRPGSVKEVSDILHSYGGRMVSILSSREEVREGHRVVYIRMHGIERPRLDQLKEELSRKAVLLYVIDQQEGRREIYVP